MNTTNQSRLIELLPALTHGNRLSVYVAILAMDDAIGVSINDVIDSTTLSRPTVSNAVRFLSRIELVEENAGRYHALANLFDITGTTNVRERTGNPRAQTRILGERPQTDVKKFFTSHDDELKELVPVENHHHHDCAEIEKILQSVGFSGKNLVELSKVIDAATADEWSEWIKNCDRSKYPRPVGYAWSCLKADPKAIAPKERRRKWYDGEFDQFVNR